MNNTPYYDSKTDTIHNCSYGQYAWFHEKVHQRQHRRWNKLGQVIDTLSVVSYYISGLLLLYYVLFWNNYVFYLIGLAWTPLSAILLILELEAYVVGTFDWLKYKVMK